MPGYIYSVPVSGGPVKTLAKHYALDSEILQNYLYFGSNNTDRQTSGLNRPLYDATVKWSIPAFR